MKRRTCGLLRRFFRSILKDGILQNLKDNGSAQQTAGFWTNPNNLANAFLKNGVKDVGYGGGQNLMIPSSFLQGPTWGETSRNYSIEKHDALETKRVPLVKTFGMLETSARIGYLNKPHSAKYCDGNVSLKDSLLCELQEKESTNRRGNKVTVVGTGSVGIACAYTLVAQHLTKDLCLVDAIKNKLEGEALDIEHGSAFVSNLHISASTDYEVSAGSAVCIVTAGARQKEGESRLSLVSRNVSIMKKIIPPLVKYSPDATLIIASNPCDVLSYISWKLSGLPKGRVFGSGTNLDSSRFRYYIAKRLGIAPGSCHGWIIGEHGDSSVALWSGVNVAGVRLIDINPCIGQPDDPENWHEVHKEVIESAGAVIKLKGYTSWAIGMSLASLTNAVLHNVQSVHAVSVLVKGLHGIKDDVFLSLPASLGTNGVNEIIIQKLTDSEKEALHKSAKIMCETQSQIKL